MNVISNILYWISTGLLVPVIVLLIYFFLRGLVMAGAFFGEYLQQKKTSARLSGRIASLTPANLPEFTESLPQEPASLVEGYMKKIIENAGNPARLDLLLDDFELATEKSIASSKVLTKMGPVLGLMGTLIPMGPALVGLATGDISSMAYNMQVAFATTVVGLVVSAIGFLTQQVKERWAMRNLTWLEYVADVVKLSKNQEQ